MIGSVHIKVCGLTRPADVTLVLAYGADFIGINCWPGSPRYVPGEARAALLREIPADRRVAITVNPTPAEAAALRAEGFAIVQAHFDPSKTECDPVALSAQIGVQALWLAPKLADAAAWPVALMPLASGFVHDAHAQDAFGGTGRRADWERFTRLRKDYPQATWILAGGLGPDNVAAAVATGATFLDLNSGIEISPGLKSAEKLSIAASHLLKITQS